MIIMTTLCAVKLAAAVVGAVKTLNGTVDWSEEE